ncbi:hypothetical protein VTK26DRAFT_7637 [Humicola hyalothermophila]
MLIIRTTDAAYAASGIRNLARQVAYYVEDMERVGERNDLWRLRIPAVNITETLNRALHEKMSKPILDWAGEEGFRIEPAAHGRPGILWLQGGALIYPSGKISIFILLRRPMSRQSNSVTEDVEGTITGLIRTPTGGPEFSLSVFEC